MPTHQEIQATIRVMTADDVRRMLRKPDLETDEAIYVRRLAAGMSPEAQRQAEYQCYVSEEGGDPLTELALDLYALVELPERADWLKRADELDAAYVAPAVSAEPPF